MKKSLYTLSLVLIFCLLLSQVGTVFAAEHNEQDFCSDVLTMSELVEGVLPTGENLIESANCQSNHKELADIKFAFNKNDIVITGTIDNIPINCNGSVIAISENGNVIAYKCETDSYQYRIAYCAVEREIDKSALYFSKEMKNQSKYNCVMKMYLVDKDDSSRYLIIENYCNVFPRVSISKDSLNNNELFWYAREFEPINSHTDEPLITAGNPDYSITSTYEFYNLGARYVHYIQYKELCDVRDVTHNQSSTANATIKIIGKGVSTTVANDSSTTNSAYSLRNVNVGYCTIPNTAVSVMGSNGLVKKNASITTSFNFAVSLNLRSLTQATSVGFSWNPGSGNYSSGTDFTYNTNTGNSYWRDAIAIMNTSCSLESIGHNYNVAWTYGSYSNGASSGTARIVFKHTLFNALNNADTQTVEHSRAITVNVI